MEILEYWIQWDSRLHPKQCYKCQVIQKEQKEKRNYKFNLAGQKNGTKILEKWKYGSVKRGWQWVGFD